MFSRSVARLLGCALFTALTLHARVSGVETPLDRGIVDGYLGVKMAATTDPHGVIPGDQVGFTVHLVPASHPDTEIIKSAGTWFVLPEKGDYRWWIEGNGLLGPSGALVFDFRKAEAGLRGSAALDRVAPAGTVLLEPSIPLPKGTVVRLLALESGFARRAARATATGGALMPPGHVVAALFDNTTNEYSAVARPATLAPGASVMVAPRPPVAPNTDLIVRVSIADRPFFDKAASPTIAAVLSDGTRRAPDAVGSDDSNIYAFWYSLVAKSVTLELTSRLYAADAVQVSLPLGSVRSVVMPFRKLPTATVTLDLPAEFPRQHAAMQVWRRGEMVRERPIGPHDEKIVLEALPADQVDLVLSSPPWRPRDELDLSDGADRATTFRVEPIRLRGRVPVCGTGEGARLRFNNGQDTWAEFTTDLTGEYEIVVFQPVTMFEIVQPGRTGSLPQALPDAIVSDRTWDVTFPCNDYRVAVHNAETGEPVAATVQVHNRTADRSEGSSRTFQTDATGQLRLPVLRHGSFALGVEAEHFRRYTSNFDIPDHSEDRTLDVRLQPEHGWATLRLLLPGGTPAAGAAVAALSLPGETILWEGTCGEDGTTEVPLNPGATHLGARDADAGFVIVPWPAEQPTEPITIGLPQKQHLVVDTGSGEGIQIAVWVAGQRLLGLPLAWLTGTSPMADNTGIWRPCCMPASGIELLAWRPTRDLDLQVRGGALDSLRVSVVPGSPSVINLAPVH
jgi:hypothetical protein